jgi:hypothetical protein
MYDEGKGVIRDYSLAHMWFNIAASLGYKYATKGREIVEKMMSPPQIKIAKKLASECVMKKHKGC